MSARLFVSIACVVVACLPVTESKSDEPAIAATPPPDPMLGKKAGEVRDDNLLKTKLVWCPPGSVTMEQVDYDERSRKPVGHTPIPASVTRGYWLGRCEITQGEWKQIMGTGPWEDKLETNVGDDFPATWVSWDDAMDFCRKMTEREHAFGRISADWEFTLPTEAQWERSCRAGTDTTFCYGDDESTLGEYAWFIKNNNDGRAHRVAQKKPNAWGLYDMHGNVWEMCRDSYQLKLPGGRDPLVSTERPERVVRGGGWSVSATFCRSAYRMMMYRADMEVRGYGFRVALSPVQTAK